MRIHVSEKKASELSIASRIIDVLRKAAFIALVLIVAALVIAVVKSFFNSGTPSVFGYQLYNVLSHSMDGYKKDSFGIGSLVLVKSTQPKDILEGDIITFNRKSEDSMLTTHRVVGINRGENGELSFTTQGDTNPSPDGSPVPAGIVLGKVIGSAPYLGYAVSFAHTKNGIALFVFIPVGLIIIYESFGMLRTLKEKRKKLENKASASESK